MDYLARTIIEPIATSSEDKLISLIDSTDLVSEINRDLRRIGITTQVTADSFYLDLIAVIMEDVGVEVQLVNDIWSEMLSKDAKKHLILDSVKVAYENPSVFYCLISPVKEYNSELFTKLFNGNRELTDIIISKLPKKKIWRTSEMS